MVYKAIGIMSGSSLDGLDIAYVHFHETGGKWQYELLHAGCYPYPGDWKTRLQDAAGLAARDYQLLHTDYGHYTGKMVNTFIAEHGLQHRVDLIASHGHTSFHLPMQQTTAQLGDGAAIAAETGLPVVSDLRALDIAFGGQGAPIVPVGEKLLLHGYRWFLNIGGIANLSFNADEGYIAFDVCPANRVLNMLARETGREYDENGAAAAAGLVDADLLQKLNGLAYYGQPWPKSLANDFGTAVVYPMIKASGLSTSDALCTMVEHVAMQVEAALSAIVKANKTEEPGGKLLVTGGGALNRFLLQRISSRLLPLSVEAEVPAEDLVNYKEALIMAFIGVLRWREEYTVLSTVTGAARSSIGGALWMGNEA